MDRETNFAQALPQAASSPLRPPLWFKDMVIYEAHVRAFFDSNGDGIGDFPGLTSKLDYIRDLGVDAIWLLPFYPSPGKDDGYDISDYHEVHPQYGTMQDFEGGPPLDLDEHGWLRTLAPGQVVRTLMAWDMTTHPAGRYVVLWRGEGELMYGGGASHRRVEGESGPHRDVLDIDPRRDGAGNWTSARIETQRGDFKPPSGGVLRIEGRIADPRPYLGAA